MTLAYVLHVYQVYAYSLPFQTTTPWSEDSSLQQTRFQRSVKMSTYLVCFIVCDFEFLETTTANNNTVRIMFLFCLNIELNISNNKRSVSSKFFFI